MKNLAWTVEQNNEATIRAYLAAVRDGAQALAHKILYANPQIDWAPIQAKYETERKG